MRSAAPAATLVEGGPPRRQSNRSIRTSTTRPANYYARSFSFRGTQAAEVDRPTDTTPGFFPAITHFTDSIAALPKEVIRHLTVLKETEGKAYGPDQMLSQLLPVAASLPAPRRESSQERTQPYVGFSMSNSANVSVSGSVTNLSVTGMPPSSSDPATAASTDPSDEIPRRELFHQLRSVLREMGNYLDEKNHYIGSANDALSKQLARLESSFPYIKDEISEEAREGSVRHWALPHNREARKANGMMTTERTRRDYQAANSLAAAAAAVHEGDVAATRSEARREAMLAKRHRNQNLDSDFDDRPIVKKSHKKVHKLVEGGDKRTVSLSANGISIQPNKRRRVDKHANGTALERPMGNALNGRLGGSPRETPALEGARKKARPHPTTMTGRKRNVGGSPSVASSPTRGTFSTTAYPRDFSPAPGARTTSSRSRQQPTQAAVPESTRHSPPATSKGQSVGLNGVTSEAGALTSLEPQPDSTETIEDTNGLDVNAPPPTIDTLKREATEPHDSATSDAANPPTATSRSRGGSKASKPSTPIITSFADATGATVFPSSRSRSTRATANGTSATHTNPPRRSHKKGTGAGAALSATIIAGELASESASPRSSSEQLLREQDDVAGGAYDADADVGGPAEDEDDDADMEGAGDGDAEEEGGSETYCICDRGSFGAMIACDNDDCAREWFHLACVGLDRAPPVKTKWYCPECRELPGIASAPTGGGEGRGRERVGR